MESQAHRLGVKGLAGLESHEKRLRKRRRLDAESLRTFSEAFDPNFKYLYSQDPFLHSEAIT